MKIGILLLGSSSMSCLRDKGLDMNDAFTAWFKAIDPTVRTETFYPPEGNYPDSLDRCEGWVLTGSHARIVDPPPWQVNFEDWIRAATHAGEGLFGTCYGLQSISRALGGGVEASPHLFQSGPRTMNLTAEGKSFFGRETLTVHQSHNDRVTTLPANFVLLGHHELCPVEGMRLGDQIFAFQGHPEFSREMMTEDINQAEGRVPPAQTAAARQGMASVALDGPWLAGKVLDFFRKRATHTS